MELPNEPFKIVTYSNPGLFHAVESLLREVWEKLRVLERHGTAAKQFIWQFQGDRVAVAAGIRLSTWKVQKVGTLKWILTGIVNPDDDFDSRKRFVRSRASGICIFYIFSYIFTGFAMFFDVF